MPEIEKNPPATNGQEQEELVSRYGNAEVRISAGEIALKIDGGQIAKSAWKAIHGTLQEREA